MAYGPDSFVTHNHFLRAKGHTAADGVTLVTQFTSDRLYLLKLLSKLWGGPISAAVYVVVHVLLCVFPNNGYFFSAEYSKLLWFSLTS